MTDYFIVIGNADHSAGMQFDEYNGPAYTFLGEKIVQYSYDSEGGLETIYVVGDSTGMFDEPVLLASRPIDGNPHYWGPFGTYGDKAVSPGADGTDIWEVSSDGSQNLVPYVAGLTYSFYWLDNQAELVLHYWDPYVGIYGSETGVVYVAAPDVGVAQNVGVWHGLITMAPEGGGE